MNKHGLLKPHTYPIIESEGNDIIALVYAQGLTDDQKKSHYKLISNSKRMLQFIRDMDTLLSDGKSTIVPGGASHRLIQNILKSFQE